MSDYPVPYYGGAPYGNQDQTHAPYLPPTSYNPHQYYPPQDHGRPAQLPIASQYDQSMSAYGYNQSIPSFSASVVASGVPPLPIFQGWNQDNFQMPPQLPQYPPQPTQMYPTYNTPPQNPQYYSQPPPVNQPAAYHVQPVVPPAQERERSEGGFDDGAVTSHPSYGEPGTNQYRGNDGTGYIDTAHRAVYARGQDPSPLHARSVSDSYDHSSAQVRQRNSASYSPYVSPTEGQQSGGGFQNGQAPSQLPKKVNGTSQQNKGHADNGVSTLPKPPTLTNGKSVPSRADSPRDASIPAAQPVQNGASKVVAYKTVAEARKKAEGAILNLWSYDVRFPHYVDEGIDATIVGSLFDELKIAKTPAKLMNGTSISQTTSSPKSAPAQKEDGPSISSSLAIDTQLKSNGKTQETNFSGALLSGEKNDKQSAASGSASTSPSVTMSAITPSAKAAAATEKEKVLQLKMEALRKSRDERAKKNAAKNAKPSDATPSTQVISSELSKSTTEAKPTTSPSEKRSPLIPAAIQPAVQSTSQSKPDLPSTSQSIETPIVTKSQSPKPAALPHLPQIPGLFLTPKAPAPAPLVTSQNTMQSSTATNHRKRPVAADFDVPSSAAPYKRPFGQSQSNERFVIDISEDEDSDGDVAMDLESRANTESPAQLPRKPTDSRNPGFANLPPLTDYRNKPFTPPPMSSALHTPPIAPSAMLRGAPMPQGLLEKESEIEQLKRKIEEAERRKKLRKPSSGTQTPRSQEASSSDTSNKVEASINMQHEISATESKIVAEQKCLAEAQALEEEKTALLRSQEAERKRLRRAKIAVTLPLVDAETRQNQLKLEQLRAEMEKMEAAVRKNLQDKKKLAEEMERLAEEQDDQIQAQKEKLENLTREEAAAPILPARPRSVEQAQGPSPPAQVSNSRSPSVPMELDKSTPEAEQQIIEEKEPSTSIPTSHSTLVNEDGTTETTSGEVLESSPNENTSEQDLEAAASEQLIKESTTDQVLEAALQEAVRADTDIQMEDSYAPDPKQLAPESPSDKSPVYSPVLNRSEIPEDSDNYEPALPDLDSDNYEPPDATPVAESPSSVPPIESADFPPFSPAFSPAPPEIPIKPMEDVIEAGEIIGDVEADQSEVHTDGENGIEESLPLQNGSVQQPIENGVQVQVDSDEAKFFTAYESPLHLFKAYRFHPEYKNKIPGGLKSLTYTHKIDPNKELCRFELMGGICNDRTCELQHFRQIGLPDDAVLTALGSPDEFHGEQRERFIDGLKQVLSDMRTRKINNFDVIAAEIVAHRSKFLGDKSKVLMLEGTSI